MTALRSGLPIEIDRLLEKALAKSPGERYQDAADVLVDLRRLRKQLTPGKRTRPSLIASGGASSKGQGLRHPGLGWVVAALCFAGMAALYLRQAPSDATQAPLRRFRFSPSVPLQPWAGEGHPNVDVSPNGRYIVFHARADTRLWVHDLEAGTSWPLDGTEGADSPLWSPGSDFIAYLVPYCSGIEVTTISAQGGVSSLVYTAPGTGVEAWRQGDLRLRRTCCRVYVESRRRVVLRQRWRRPL